MKKYDVIGLMSGTSLDGLDMAFVRFYHKSKWFFEIIQCHTIPYDTKLFNKLKYATELSGLELKKLDVQYGQWIGKQVKSYMDDYKLAPELIVSHGHTIFHQPEIGVTHQIGDGYKIMLETNVKTVCDLRSLDVSLGGQGAPLVPIGDKLLFGEYDLCLNLGGFANVSFDKHEQRIAYDICPVNTVLNELASRLNLSYDKDGQLARSGSCNNNLLHKLNAMTYYIQKPPKSLGMEWVRQYIFPLLQHDTLENLLNTYCYHIARQITDTLKVNFQHSSAKPATMLVTGGGAKNKFLMDLLKSESVGNLEIIVPSVDIIEFKEAIIFAFLGLLRTLGEVNTLQSVTGAKTNSSGGLIYDQIPGLHSP